MSFMKKRNIVILISLVLFGLMTALAIYFVWPAMDFAINFVWPGKEVEEIQVLETKKSPDGSWTAIVQMEVVSAPAFVDDAVYAVRLKGSAQKDPEGDLVMNVPVSYPDPQPSIDWSDGKLVVTLANQVKYRNLANPVDGIPIAVQQEGPQAEEKGFNL
jgi:hypothetical protein